LKSREFLFKEYLREAPIANALWRSFEYNRYSMEKIRKPILDLGCGDGFFVSRAFPTKMDVGLDIDSRELRSAKKRKCYLRLVRGDARRLPFADKSFHTVISNCVLEHIPDIGKTLQEIRRVLKPGGWLFMTVPSEYYGRYYGPKNLAVFGGKTLTFLLNRLFRHLYVENLPSWQRRFRNAGLALVKAEFLIPRKTFNVYLGLLIPAFPSKISKLLLGKWILSPRGWLGRLLPGLFHGILNRKDEKGVCYYFAVRRRTRKMA
jgi:SAM-dependent methyltransferase